MECLLCLGALAEACHLYLTHMHLLLLHRFRQACRNNSHHKDLRLAPFLDPTHLDHLIPLSKLHHTQFFLVNPIHLNEIWTLAMKRMHTQNTHSRRRGMMSKMKNLMTARNLNRNNTTEALLRSLVG